MWPNRIPSGANRNAQTSDAMAMPLVGRGDGEPYPPPEVTGGGYGP
jgi:hypothetical protein